MYIGNNEINAVYLGSEEITKIYQGNTVIYEKGGDVDYTTMPLTFEITGDGDIKWVTSNISVTKTIEYKLNDGEWTSITSDTGSSAPSISVESGDTIQFRGDNTQYSTKSNSYCTFSGSTAQFKVKGNIMSLINSTNFSTLTTLSSNYTFNYLFYNCTGLTDASKLVLPATTLALHCYINMFAGCTGLTTAPELPATTLKYDCYNSMFNGCTALTTAPELPATALTGYCYNGMFAGCTSLNYIKCLATDISASNCTRDWVNGVASSGTFVTPSSTAWSTGTSGIPTNWTRVDA